MSATVQFFFSCSDFSASNCLGGQTYRVGLPLTPNPSPALGRGALKLTEKGRESLISRFFFSGSFPILLLFLMWTVALIPCDGFSQSNPEDTWPLLLSVSPLAAQRGKSLKVEARGNRL